MCEIHNDSDMSVSSNFEESGSDVGPSGCHLTPTCLLFLVAVWKFEPNEISFSRVN